MLNNCTQSCNQGRSCTCEPMEDQTVSIYETLVDFILAGVMALGTVTFTMVMMWLGWRVLG